jgi:hypothetical protein
MQVVNNVYDVKVLNIFKSFIIKPQKHLETNFFIIFVLPCIQKIAIEMKVLGTSLWQLFKQFYAPI